MAPHILSRATRTKHTLYFVHAPIVDLVKIGITGHFEQRFRSLCDCSPAPLVVLHTLAGTARQEGALHCRFLADRTHSEWFRFSEGLRSLIETLKVSSPAQVGALFRTMRTFPRPRRSGISMAARERMTRSARDDQRERAQRLWSAVEQAWRAAA